jgi:isopenicillin-N N-acyltransferase-like protein
MKAERCHGMSSKQANTPSIDESAAATDFFPSFTFRGTQREIGRQFGEACQGLIRRHLDLAMDRLGRRQDLTANEALSRTEPFRAYVERDARFLAEEIHGLSEGAGITRAEAYLLQLRAELDHHSVPDPDASAECTTFVALAENTTDGIGIIGQNADLPEFYSELGVVVELRPEGAPSVLMLTPAGQVSYVGINDRGLGVFANYLICDGWREGFPRYLYSRMALRHDNVNDGLASVRRLHRASSRNLIMLDAHGNGTDFENTPTRDGCLSPEGGLLAHSNHYITPALQEEERSSGVGLENSRVRLERITSLLERGKGRLDIQAAMTIFRDREMLPHCICRLPGDLADSDVITFASVIAEPSEGRMWVAKGPPNQHAYRLHTFSS